MTSDKIKFPTYGKALAKARKIIGLKQGEFAKKISTAQSQVSRWETTEAIPIDSHREKISQVLSKKGLNIAPDLDGWRLTLPSTDAEKGSQDVDRAKEKVAEYKSKGPDLDDLPEILRLKNELEEWIDELLKTKPDPD